MPIPFAILVIARSLLYRPVMNSLDKLGGKLANLPVEPVQNKTESAFQNKIICSNDFVENLNRLYLLYKDHIYTDAEFNFKKIKLIWELAEKKINISTTIFLINLIPLKEASIINQEDINLIKQIIS